MQTGTVKWFNASKGFGFIAADDKSMPDLFVHYSEIAGNGYKELKEGQRVQFEPAKGPKGYQARGVTPI